MNNDRLEGGLTKEEVGRAFSLTWFGRSLARGSGAKLWSDGGVSILGQPPYRLDIPVNWLDDPYSHRSWRWILNSFQWMDQLLARFKLDQSEDAIKTCADYFLDWANFYIVAERKGEFLWKDDAVSFRTFRLSLIAFYVLSSVEYTEDQKFLTENVLRKHYSELSNPKRFKSNNHGIFQMRALMSLLALHPEIGDVEASKRYVTKRLNWLWVRQYGVQNLHLENSTGYHQYIIKEFEEVLDSPELSSLAFAFNKATIEEVKSNARFLFHPNGTGTLFGDSNLVHQEHEVVMGDHLFNEAGYAILAGSDPTKMNSYLAVRTGFPSNAHRHSDDFSFEWSEKGRVIFQDSGRFAYDYDNPARKFVTSTMAHNTVSIDKLNYPWWGQFEKSDFYQGAVTEMHSGDQLSMVSLYKYFERLVVGFSRKLVFRKGVSLEIQDKLSSGERREFIQWFHFSEEFIPETNVFGKVTVFRGKEFNIKVEALGDAEILACKGQDNPYYQGWISYKERVLVPRWALGFRLVGKDVSLKTRFTIVE